MKRHHHSSIAGETAGRGGSESKSGGTPAEEKADMDELLAVLGYKVRSSDMAEVAENLEKLDMAMNTAEEDDILHLSSETVHYNPSDLSSWIHSMLGELHLHSGENSMQEPEESSDLYDLSAIPGDALCSNKRFKTSSSQQVVMVDSQETGVRLVHTLLACAEAVDQGDMQLADALVKQVGLLATAQAGAMRKVALYFAEALARRIYSIFPRDSFDSSDMLQMQFYDVSPYLKFAHFTANQAILEALSSSERVHVIDFGANQGLQWPALMQALALRAEGPPTFHLTVIAEVEDDDSLNPIGVKLADLARIIGIEFEFNRLPVRSFADLEYSLLDLRPAEDVAINAVFELHRLLSISGAVEKMLSSIKFSNPRIVTIVEQEANHNGTVFLDRFNQALHYYSAFFDSLEGSVSGPSGSAEVVMAEMYLGRQICNVVACEGLDRVERHEPLSQWRNRFESAGFCPVHIGSNAFAQASMLALFSGGEGYRVEENDGCLMLGWQTRPLIATSAWKPDPNRE